MCQQGGGAENVARPFCASSRTCCYFVASIRGGIQGADNRQTSLCPAGPIARFKHTIGNIEEAFVSRFLEFSHCRVDSLSGCADKRHGSRIRQITRLEQALGKTFIMPVDRPSHLADASFLPLFGGANIKKAGPVPQQGIESIVRRSYFPALTGC